MQKFVAFTVVGNFQGGSSQSRGIPPPPNKSLPPGKKPYKVHVYCFCNFIAAAVHVLCQELTTSLPEGNDACTRNEVTFTCTIRGSASLTRLILTWRSDEYIGNVLQFTTADDPGENVISMVNGNVTAVLINNTEIDGVPVLVSELRIVSANQNSIITCNSETSSSPPSSTEFIVPGTYVLH